MWELILANKRKSIILFLCMGISLLVLGYFIGACIDNKSGGNVGLLIALVIWIVGSVVSYFSGDSILLGISGAKEVSRDLHPQLFNIVEEMKIAGNLPAMPRVYIIPDPAPNAFAVGRKPEKSAVAVTAGLLTRLNRDELQGVIAHEMSHIMNRDVLFMTFAGVLLGSIVFISHIFLRSMWYSSGSSRRYRSGKSSKGGGGHPIVLVVAIVLAILAPLLAHILYFAISRKREYLADASAVRLTRYPEGLASALESISSSTLDLASANKATAPMYIVNPLKKERMALSDLSSTHPPISERIKILRSMSHGANYLNYQQAYASVKGSPSPLIPKSGLKETGIIPMRKGSVEKKKIDNKKDARDIGDLIRAVNKYIFLICACGLKIKVPHDVNKSKLACPKCKREIDIPLTELAAVTAAAGVLTAKEKEPEKKAGHIKPITSAYTRKGTGWESLSCGGCGKLLQLSPQFVGHHLTCSVCKSKTVIKHYKS